VAGLNAAQPGFEFLIRKGPEDYVLKRVSSFQAFSFLRPKRIPRDLLEIKETVGEGGPVYLVKISGTGKIVRLSEKAFDFWSQMDGHTPLRTLAAGYFLKYGGFDFNQIRRMVHELQKTGLLETEIPPLARLRQTLIKHRNPLSRLFSKLLLNWSLLEVRYLNVDAEFQELYRWLGPWFFNPVLFAGSLAMEVWGAILFLRWLPRPGNELIPLFDSPWKWLIGCLILVPLVMIQQLAYAIATKHCGYKVREIGFTLLHHWVPVCYVDVTDIWMASPQQRLMITLSGPYVTWLMGSVAAIAGILVFPGVHFLHLLAFYCYIGTLINLYPFLFLEFDGYYALVDLLRLPFLRSRAFEIGKAVLRGEHVNLKKRENAFAALYGVLSLASLVLLACVLRKLYGF
jgi:hypothetical protein